MTTQADKEALVARLVKIQSVGGSLLSNATAALKGVQAITVDADPIPVPVPDPVPVPVPDLPLPGGITHGVDLTPSNVGLASAGLTEANLTAYTGGLTITGPVTRKVINLGGNQLVLGAGAALTECIIKSTRQGGQGQVKVTGSNVSITRCDHVSTAGSGAESIGIFTVGADNLTIASLRMTGPTIFMWLDGNASTPMSVSEFYGYAQVGGGAHHDGITRRESNSPLTISRSRVTCDQGSTTGAFFVQDTWNNPRSASNVGYITVQDSYLEGNGYNATLELSNNLVFINNRFRPTEYGAVTQSNGPVSGLTWTGNYLYSATGPDFKGAAIS